MGDDMQYLLRAVLVLAMAVLAFLFSNRFFRWCDLESGKEPSPTMNNTIGLVTFVIGACSVACITYHIPSEDAAISPVFRSGIQAIAEITKMIFGALGAMYLKSGYEAWEKSLLTKAKKGQCAVGMQGASQKTIFYFSESTPCTQEVSPSQENNK